MGDDCRLVTNFVEERRPMKMCENACENFCQITKVFDRGPSLIYELLSTPECVLGEHEIETISRAKVRPLDVEILFMNPRT